MSEGKLEATPSRVWIGPARCDNLSREMLINRLVSQSRGDTPKVFFNLNAHALNLILADRELAAVFNGSTATFCDGFGILLLAHAFRLGRISHRMTPPDFVDAVYARLCAAGKTVFFLGDESATVATYATKVASKYPGVVAGWHHGFFERGSAEERQIVNSINAAHPHLLLLGMGMPRQERWAMDNRAAVLCASILSVGALFSWGTSARRRGPRWATDHGMEWLFRLFLEPKRVWRRYLIGLPQVVWRLYLYQLHHHNG